MGGKSVRETGTGSKASGRVSSWAVAGAGRRRREVMVRRALMRYMIAATDGSAAVGTCVL